MIFTAPLALLLLVVLVPTILLGLPRVPFRRGRDLASLILRCLILTLVILALAGLQVVRAADRLAVVFLVDASDSINANDREAQLVYMRDALSRMTPDDRAAVVVFGANALVERTLSSVRELPGLRSSPVTSNSDLADAIRIGLSLFPADAARRLVILSDGAQTIGDAAAAARRAAATNVEISYVPYTRDPVPEVQVTDVRVPETVGVEQEFDLGFTIQAEAATEGTVTVLAAGEVLLREDVSLREGENNYAVTLQAGEAGFRDFQVRVDPAGGDAFYQNNQLAAFSQVVGPPRVLLVEGNPTEGESLAAALTEIGLVVDRVAPTQLPVGIAPLTEYESVLLANVPATSLTTRRMETLATYVRDLGGGLVVIGGPDSYAPGGYFQTPLEEALPVEMQIRDQQRLPQLTIAYVIDRSGSMGAAGPSGVANIELAKEAMIRSIEFLQPSDRAGVISFDTNAAWIAEIQPVFDRIGLQTLIGTLRASGGTDIEAGYNQAAEALATDPSTRKHIILLTDGGADPGALVETAGSLLSNGGVTTSVISIGAGADFLNQMAQAGGGNYHEVITAEQIPTIFASETVLATRAYIIEEEPFVPAQSANSPIMDGITSAPPLLGYVASTPKQTAQVILRTPNSFADPILATWQYGLGRTVAFTSDATSRWGVNWVTWDDFARFWGQTVRSTITEVPENNIETRVIMEGEQARVIVDARTPEGDFLNGLELEATLVDPELSTGRLTLQQVAPGRYEAAFTPGTEGAYFLRLNGSEGSTPLSQTTGWVMSYSAEYSTRPADEGLALLAELAGVTGGRSLLEDPGAVFAHNLEAAPSYSPMAPWLLLIAVLLLPVDIAVRRLLITRSDLARLRAAVFRPRTEAETSARMSSLMEAKARARDVIASEGAAEADKPATPAETISALRQRRAAERTESPPPAEAPSRPPPAAPRGDAAAPPKPDTSIAGKLLDKRREREKR